MKKLAIIMLFILLTGCTKSASELGVETNTSSETSQSLATSQDDVYGTHVDQPGRPAIKADEVKEDARLYLDPDSESSSWIGINMGFDDVAAVLKAAKIDIGERGYYESKGGPMEGWWFDGISNLQLPGMTILFDKAGNLFDIEITDHYQTAKGIGVGATKDEVLAAYGTPEYTVEYVTHEEVLNFGLDKFAVRFLLMDGKVTEIKVTETVMQYVLQEFMQ